MTFWKNSEETPDMLDGPEKMQLPTIAGEPAELQVNWTPEAVGKFVRLIVGGKSCVIPHASFVRAAMIIASPTEQEAMIPTRQVMIRHYKKDVLVKMKQNMKRGEILKIPVSFDIPLTEGCESLILASK